MKTHFFLCRIHQARVAADKRNNVDSLLDHIQIVIVVVDPPRRFVDPDNLASLRITYRKHLRQRIEWRSYRRELELYVGEPIHVHGARWL